ncbi:MAG: hypothetical protein LH618_16785, partial [Saprospiraceae bacterium]|nr:hypothetical protein [Saprospiraceae bacterium]
QRLAAVTDQSHWQNTDLAFTEIVKRLRELIAEIRQQKVNRPTAVVASGDSRPQDPWHMFFQTCPPKKNLRLPDAVNCNRLEHYQAQLERHFEDNKAKPGNLLYLLTACDTQNPTSLPKRLAYWFDEDISLFFRPDDEKRKDELTFLDWPLEKKALHTWAKFWELFQDNILHARVDFEAFIQDPALFFSIPEGTRVLLSFQISESDLLEYKAHAHVRYMLEQLARLPLDYQKFVFCFVFHFPDVHDTRKGECEHLLNLLDDFAKPAEESPPWVAALHLSCLPAVSENDLKVWWVSRFEHTHFADLSREIKTRVEPDKRDACLQNARFDMHTIETMQYAAYTFTRDNF